MKRPVFAVLKWMEKYHRNGLHKTIPLRYMHWETSKSKINYGKQRYGVQILQKVALVDEEDRLPPF